jgi:hypothetical protein
LQQRIAIPIAIVPIYFNNIAITIYRPTNIFAVDRVVSYILSKSIAIIDSHTAEKVSPIAIYRYFESIAILRGVSGSGVARERAGHWPLAP